jgi:hypothetical protein
MKMKKPVTLLSALAVTLMMAMPAAAQYVTKGEIENFNAFLNAHPNTAAELHRNPSLVDNANFLQQRPELHSYLAEHDQLRKAIQTHPGQFMYSKGRYSYGWGRGGWNPAWSHQPSREEWERMHNYGYYDPDDRQWHSREWWEHHRADWVKKHHPRWEAANTEQRENYEEWQEHHPGDAGDHQDSGKHKGWYKHGHDND